MTAPSSEPGTVGTQIAYVNAEKRTEGVSVLRILRLPTSWAVSPITSPARLLSAPSAGSAFSKGRHIVSFAQLRGRMRADIASRGGG